MNKLAIKGGKPVRTKLFPAYNTIGREEKKAVMEVLDSGNLSQFLGVWADDFFGGPKVRSFEEAWAKAIGSTYAVAVNSNTSGLFASMGAIGIRPGDEVIVSPYTMSASAVAPLVYGGIPVFADIDPVTFCLDPKSIETKISQYTKAILVVHLFGHPADISAILSIARKHNLFVIEDCAQAPLARYNNSFVGSVADLGVFSFNYHKHIHTGEGGMITGNDPALVEKCQLIRNHGENVVEQKGVQDLTNMIGYNYRMTEMESVIGIEQLKKLPALLIQRQENVRFLEEKLSCFPALEFQPRLPNESFHTFYVHPVKFKKRVAGIHRDVFIQAIKAELPSAFLRETAPLIGAGYVKPLYLQPLYQKKASWAFDAHFCDREINYAKGLCPVTESMHFEELFTHEYMRPGMTKKDLNDVVNAFDKVFSNLHELT